MCPVSWSDDIKDDAMTRTGPQRGSVYLHMCWGLGARCWIYRRKREGIVAALEKVPLAVDIAMSMDEDTTVGWVSAVMESQKRKTCSFYPRIQFLTCDLGLKRWLEWLGEEVECLGEGIAYAKTLDWWRTWCFQRLSSNSLSLEMGGSASWCGKEVR